MNETYNQDKKILPFIVLIDKMINNFSFNTNANIETDFNNIINLVKDEQSLSFNQKCLLIGTASIAKYSCEFWKEAQTSPNNPYHQFFRSANYLFKTNYDWTNAADAAGYIVGYNQVMSGTDPSCAGDAGCYQLQTQRAYQNGIANGAIASATYMY